MAKTQHRSIRVDDPEWADLETATAATGSNRAEAINAFIDYFLARPGAEFPTLPPGHPDATGAEPPLPAQLVTEQAVDLAVEAVEGQGAWQTAADDPFARRLLTQLALQAAAPVIARTGRTVARVRARRTARAAS